MFQFVGVNLGLVLPSQFATRHAICAYTKQLSRNLNLITQFHPFYANFTKKLGSSYPGGRRFESCLRNHKKFKVKFCESAESRLTHILTHNRLAPSGQSSIFQNTMSTKSEKPRKFQNFLKRISLRPPGAAHDVQNLSQRRPPAPGEIFFVYSVTIIEIGLSNQKMYGDGLEKSRSSFYYWLK